MKFHPTAFEGVVLVEMEPLEDERGHFARTFCAEEFAKQGLISEFKQCNLSYNHLKGTLRGMHLQAEPFAEAKLLRCLRGSIYDVVIDLRPESKTFQQWMSFEFKAGDCQALYIPKNMAHGFQTLENGTELFYQMSDPYRAEASRGIRWDDPAFAIAWPLPPCNISAKDRQYPLYAHWRTDAKNSCF